MGPSFEKVLSTILLQAHSVTIMKRLEEMEIGTSRVIWQKQGRQNKVFNSKVYTSSVMQIMPLLFENYH